MRKIIIISALCICAIGIVLISNKSNKSVSYSSTNSTACKLEKRNISSTNQREYKSLTTQIYSKTKAIKINPQYKRASLKALDRKITILKTQSSRSGMHQSLGNNIETINKKQGTKINRLSQSINIEDFSNINSFNSPKENILKTDMYIPMQFGFPDEGQLNTGGEMPLNNEFILIIIACFFIFLKKR